jgi:hypothetical protein
MTFARRVYRIAGVYGLLLLLPSYFFEARIGLEHPPAITHPEYYYGFTAVTVAWQVAFLVIASDPRKYRALMPVTFLEKLAGAQILVLYFLGRVDGVIAALWSLDLVWLALFVAAYLKAAPAP